ncbi:MAG: autotransporter-associated beta strand repeat-containing protein [Planctomycetia bacterium]|nr:autotransporter-associated beta strand repeat-containing protein [Planctomycetia bacterium]
MLKKTFLMILAVCVGSTLCADQTFTNLNDTTDAIDLSTEGVTLETTTDSVFSKAISAGTLTKTGDATQTLSGTITVGGVTTISAGTLKLLDASASLTSTGTLTVAGGAGLVFENALSKNTSALTIKLSSDASGTATVTYDIDYVPTNPNDYNTVHTAENSISTNAAVSFTGSGNFIKTGTGTLALANGDRAVTFALDATSTIDIQEGVLLNGGWSSHKWGDNLASLNLESAGTLDVWNGPSITVGAITGSGSIVSNTLAGHSSSTLTFGAGDASGEFSGTLDVRTAGHTGGTMGKVTLSLTKTGTGTQTFSGTTAYDGATTVSAGTLKFTNGAKVGTGAVTVDGTLEFEGAQTFTSLSGSGKVTGTGNLTLNWTGAGHLTNSLTLDIGNNTFIKTGSGRARLNKNKASSWTVGGYEIQEGQLCFPEAYSSTTPITLNGGTLQRNGDADGDSSGTTTLLANPIYVSTKGGGLMAGWSGILNVTGNISNADGVTNPGNLVIQTDSGNVRISGGGVVNTTAILQVNPQNTATTNNLEIQKDTTFGGLAGKGYASNTGTLTLNVAGNAEVTYSGVLSGSGGVTKTGAGTQTFSNANLTLAQRTSSRERFASLMPTHSARAS